MTLELIPDISINSSVHVVIQERKHLANKILIPALIMLHTLNISVFQTIWKQFAPYLLLLDIFLVFKSILSIFCVKLVPKPQMLSQRPKFADKIAKLDGPKDYFILNYVHNKLSLIVVFKIIL